MEDTTSIIEKAEKAASEILLALPESMVYHNLKHTKVVVNAAEKIGSYSNVNEEEHEILMISAWFHDTGHIEDYKNHEEKSVEITRKFLKENNYPADKTKKVTACILSTKINVKPKTRIEKVLHDADFIHLAKRNYFDKLLLLKNERERQTGEKTEEFRWNEQNLAFLKNHEYCTEYGKTVLGPKVDKNIDTQIKMLKRLSKLQHESAGKELNLDPERVKQLKKKIKKIENRPDRGIETMFRLTSRNHLQLSAMADSKANILISVNAIIISIIISGLIKTLDNHPHLMIPTYLILSINVVTIVFSILTLRPNISKGKFTREDIENKNTNLLFFGNFYGMTREDYQWGMTEMMNDSEYLYSSLIDDIYFLGKVLGRKYKYLHLSYSIFMYGIVIAVIAYGIANLYYLSTLGI